MSWQSKLIQYRASIPARVSKARAIYKRYKPVFNKYAGGCPVGFLAAIVEFESGGRPTVKGDPSLDEYGLFQISKHVTSKFGVPSSLKYKIEGNIFLGALLYNYAAADLKSFFPWLPINTPDTWKLARLYYSIGPSGTRKLLRAANVRPQFAWADLVAYVDRIGGTSLGRQSAGKVWYRVHAVEVQWLIGAATAPAIVGAPVAIIPPNGVNYTIPARARQYMPSPWRGPVVGAVLLAISALVVW